MCVLLQSRSTHLHTVQHYPSRWDKINNRSETILIGVNMMLAKWAAITTFQVALDKSNKTGPRHRGIPYWVADFNTDGPHFPTWKWELFQWIRNIGYFQTLTRWARAEKWAWKDVALCYCSLHWFLRCDWLSAVDRGGDEATPIHLN